MRGWIKFYREWLLNPIINKDTEYLAVWVYLISNAVHSAVDCIFNGKKITLIAGQMIVALREIYEELKIDRNKLNRILKSFKSEGLIEQQTNNHKSLITLALWEYYQGINEQPNEQPVSNQRATEQETEKEKEKSSKREKVKEKEINNNDKNVRIYSGQQLAVSSQPIEDMLFEEFWQCYPKKVAKGYARECFKKISPTRELVNNMIEAIKDQKRSDMWKRNDGQYIPNPSTWLNQQRWEDNLTIEHINTEITFDADDFFEMALKRSYGDDYDKLF